MISTYRIPILVALAALSGASIWLFTSRAPEGASTPNVQAAGSPPAAAKTSSAPRREAVHASSLAQALQIEDFFARTNALRTHFTEWAATDPAAAAAELVKLDPKFRDYGCLEIVALALARTNPLKALEFASQLQEYRMEEFVQRITIAAWALRDPEAAARAVTSRIPQARQVPLLAGLAPAWAKQRPGEALAFAEQITDPAVKSAFLARALAGAAASSPELAVQAWNNLPDSANRTNFAAAIARSWAQSDPKAAALWAASLTSDEPARVAAVGESVARWSRTRPKEAATFVDSLDRSATRDIALLALVDGVADNDPDLATARAATIDRHEERLAAYLRIADAVAALPMEEAQVWLDSLGGIPDTWQVQLVRRLNRDGASQIDPEN